MAAAADVTPRVRVPETARRGEVIEIKTLISHPMETGERADLQGGKIPRRIITRFVCTYNGEVVFSADWHPSVSANPYLAFTTVATESGEIVLSWTDDDGSTYLASAHIEVQ
jgi:sulfur-oxidizing protein SoxZ